MTNRLRTCVGIGPGPNRGIAKTYASDQLIADIGRRPVEQLVEETLTDLYRNAGRDLDAEGGIERVLWSDLDGAKVTLPDGTEVDLIADPDLDEPEPK